MASILIFLYIVDPIQKKTTAPEIPALKEHASTSHPGMNANVRPDIRESIAINVSNCCRFKIVTCGFFFKSFKIISNSDIQMQIELKQFESFIIESDQFYLVSVKSFQFISHHFKSVQICRYQLVFSVICQFTVSSHPNPMYSLICRQVEYSETHCFCSYFIVTTAFQLVRINEISINKCHTT